MAPLERDEQTFVFFYKFFKAFGFRPIVRQGQEPIQRALPRRDAAVLQEWRYLSMAWIH